LSYVNQNYLFSSPSRKLNYRSYYLWLQRNSQLILTLITYTNKMLLTNLRVVKTQQFLQQLSRVYFRSGLFKPFSHLSPQWKPILESQFVRGLEYWSYRPLVQALSLSQAPYNLILPTSDLLFYNQVFYDNKYIAVSVSNRYYRVMLTHLLLLLLKPWQLWNPLFSHSYNFLASLDAYSLVRFYNSRFFKVYSV
jgi:hypothetical protein